MSLTGHLPTKVIAYQIPNRWSPAHSSTDTSTSEADREGVCQELNKTTNASERACDKRDRNPPQLARELPKVAMHGNCPGNDRRAQQIVQNAYALPATRAALVPPLPGCLTL
jgi:hypothetical protein